MPADLAPVAAGSPIRFGDRRAMLELNLARQTEAIRASDAKINLLVPTTTAMLGVLAALFRLAHLGPQAAAYVAVGTLPLIAAYGLMAVAIIPRFRGGRSTSLLFFGGLAARGAEEARAALLALDEESYLADLAGQCHVTAGIARSKYRHVRNAYIAFIIALPFWALAIYVLTRPV